MKWLEEVYGLFVDDPRLALMALISLAVATVVSLLGAGWLAGLVLVVLVAASLMVSTVKD